MGHYAKVNPLTMKVEKVIVTEKEFIDSLPDRDFWLKTSFNINGGIYYDPATGNPADDQTVIDKDQGRQRKNYAKIGSTYSAEYDAFIPLRLFPSWNLNKDTCLWEPPIPYPDDGKIYSWDEKLQNWRLDPENQ